MAGQGKYWCFTWNNPNLYPERLGAEFVELPNFKYVVFQLEKGDNGTKHYQGYLELEKNIRLGGLKAFNSAFHWEKRRGTQKEARDYCMKEDSRLEGPFEYGEFEPTKQGKRNDLLALREGLLQRRKTLNQAVRKCENNQQLSFVLKLSAYVPLSNEYKKKQVYWLWGKTGTGKTKTAMLSCPPEDTWISKMDSQWFDGYSGQGYVIIDEFRGRNWKYDVMLQLLDGYEMSVPIKGGFTRWHPHTIYITCPYPPDEVYFGQLALHGSIDQLLRRITEIRNMNEESLYCDEDITQELPNQEQTFTELLEESCSPLDVSPPTLDTPPSASMPWYKVSCRRCNSLDCNCNKK